MKKSILICDDEPTIRLLFSELLKDDYDIAEASNGNEAISMVNNEPFDLLIMDIRMPQNQDLEIIKFIREKQKSIPIIICSADPLIKSEFFMKSLNRAVFFAKPLDINELKQAVFDLIGS